MYGISIEKFPLFCPNVKINIEIVLNFELISLIKRVLVREPENRISLEELSKSSWMQAEKPVEDDLVPLVWRQNVKQEDQNDIIHQMVIGKIATKESILK